MTEDNQLPDPLDPPQEAPQAAPRITSQSLSKVKTSISDSINAFLTASGNNANEIQADLKAYLARIQPILDEQLLRAAQDPDVAYTNIKYIWATVWAESGRVSLGAIYRERQAITAMVLSGLQMAIALA